MADPVNFKSEFDILAKDGAIGAPDGAAAYAYIRVSDSDQAEDGRSGLPRQIQNIHEVATQRGYRIPWELVYAEDHTGFEFETRLQLAKLRRAFKSPTRAADVVVIEHLDGLSRESNWHQGFLLDEMQKHGIQAVFWKSFGSRIERAVMGAVSQDAMEQAKQRMQAGTRRRAERRKLVTAKTPAFGYRIVDEGGNENTTEARRNGNYVICEPEAETVRYMYAAVLSGMPLRALANELNRTGRTPRPTKKKPKPFWEAATIRFRLHNPVYKGQFAANRRTEVRRIETLPNGDLKVVRNRVVRPQDEWIVVPVPPIVSESDWDAVQEQLAKNKRL